MVAWWSSMAQMALDDPEMDEEAMRAALAAADTGQQFALMHHPRALDDEALPIVVQRDADGWAVNNLDGSPAPSIGGLVDGRHPDINQEGNEDESLVSEFRAYYLMPTAADIAAVELAEKRAGPAAQPAAEQPAATGQLAEGAPAPVVVLAGANAAPLGSAVLEEAGNGAAGHPADGETAGGLAEAEALKETDAAPAEADDDADGGVAANDEAGGEEGPGPLDGGQPFAAGALDDSTLGRMRLANVVFAGETADANVSCPATLLTHSDDPAIKADSVLVVGDEGGLTRLVQKSDVAGMQELLSQDCSVAGNTDPNGGHPHLRACAVVRNGAKLTYTLLGEGQRLITYNPDYQLYTTAVPHEPDAAGNMLPITKGALINSALTGNAAVVVSVVRSSPAGARGRFQYGVVALNEAQKVMWCAPIYPFRNRVGIEH
jgi:hypothetical protein